MTILKALGTAIFALLAISAVSASGAQAEVTFTSGLTPSTHTAVSLHARQLSTTANITDNSIGTGVGTVTCSNFSSTFTGSTTGTDKTLTITPTYIHCTTITFGDSAGTPVTITMNGCDFVFNQPSTIAGTSKYTGTMNLECPLLRKMEIEVYLSGTVTSHSTKICTVSIGEQKQLSHVIYVVTAGTPGTKADIDMEITASNIFYTTSGLCGSGAGNATYTSSLTLTSTNHDLWMSD